MIRGTFSTRNRGVMMKLYKASIVFQHRSRICGEMWIHWKEFRGGQIKGWRVLRGLATRIDYGN